MVILHGLPRSPTCSYYNIKFKLIEHLLVEPLDVEGPMLYSLNQSQGTVRDKCDEIKLLMHIMSNNLHRSNRSNRANFVLTSEPLSYLLRTNSVCDEKNLLSEYLAPHIKDSQMNFVCRVDGQFNVWESVLVPQNTLIVGCVLEDPESLDRSVFSKHFSKMIVSGV